MLAHYGYSDASGNYFITIDTGKCNACGRCVSACPRRIFLAVDCDPNDPLNDVPLVVVSHEKKNKLKYECGPCKPQLGSPLLPCTAACSTGAISHSW